LELEAQRKDDYCYKSILKAVSGKYRWWLAFTVALCPNVFW